MNRRQIQELFINTRWDTYDWNYHQQLEWQEFMFRVGFTWPTGTHYIFMRECCSINYEPEYNRFIMYTDDVIKSKYRWFTWEDFKEVVKNSKDKEK